jgi:hypothetical protein
VPDNALSKNALSPSAISANAVSASAVPGNSLSARDHLSLERLKLASDVLLSNHDDIPVELTLFRECLEHALLLPANSARAAGHGLGTRIQARFQGSDDAPDVPGRSSELPHGADFDE